MSRTKESDLSLEALIADITDEARLKSKKSGGGSSALYGNSSKAPASNKKPGGRLRAGALGGWVPTPHPTVGTPIGGQSFLPLGWGLYGWGGLKK